MRLFIAEKPIQAAAIADALADPLAQQRHPYAIQCGDDVVTWAEGHLYEQVEPEYYNPEYKRWRLRDLPIIPERWVVLPIKTKHAHIAAINALLEQADTIVHACDPDREGQLIGDEILAKGPQTPAVKTALRLWPQGLDPTSIRQAVEAMRPNADYRNITLAALVRSRADWLVGMNLSRKCTLEARNAGYTMKFAIGRVKTPTLALVVQRDREIAQFVPKVYLTLDVTFDHANGPILTTWKPRELDADGHLCDTTLLEALRVNLPGKTGTVQRRSESPETLEPPLPLDLTTLMAQASQHASMTAKHTLNAAQSLYERHHAISYPRTSCRYLNERDHQDAAAVLLAIAKNDPTKSPLCQQADLTRVSAAWNTAKAGAVASHTAIVPTTSFTNVGTMNAHEQIVYDLVCRAYLAQFYPPAYVVATTIAIHCEGESFEATHRDELSAGWRVIYPPRRVHTPTAPIVPAEHGDRVTCTHTQTIQHQTTAPRHFTDGTLIEAMQQIHRFMDRTEERLRARLQGIGIGTDATRPEIIESLITRDKLIRRQGIFLVATEEGHDEITALHDYEQLTKPDTTAINEERLENIRLGRESYDGFMREQERMVCDLVRLLQIAPKPNAQSLQRA